MRDINFFRLSEGKRERIEEMSESEIEEGQKVLSKRFVAPLVSEMILPNIAYVGGGAEIAFGW